MLRTDRTAGGVTLVTLDWPESLNAITMELQAELDALLAELSEDGQTRCVVLTGTGERAFSAGYDVHEMAEWAEHELAVNLAQREAWLWRFAQTPVPVVAAL